MIARVVGVALAVALLAACSTSNNGTPAAVGSTGSTTAAATPSASPLPTVTPPDVACGNLQVAVDGVQGGWNPIVGTHAEWYSKKGQFVRVRVLITNLDPVFHNFHLLQSPVRDATGAEILPDRQANLIKRQNEEVSLGGQNLARFDIWYDLATSAHPVTLLLHQDTTCVRPVKLPALKKK